jgi:hypothetical protein
VHTTLVAVHAAAASVALLAGLAVPRVPRLVGVHAASTALMTAALAGALWVGRSVRAASTDAVLLALLVLGVVMTVRSACAWRDRPTAGGAVSAGVVASVGSTCTGLVTGLLAVGSLRTGGGPGVVVVAVLLPVTVGHLVVGRAVRARRRPPGRT